MTLKEFAKLDTEMMEASMFARHKIYETLLREQRELSSEAIFNTSLEGCDLDEAIEACEGAKL